MRRWGFWLRIVLLVSVGLLLGCQSAADKDSAAGDLSPGAFADLPKPPPKIDSVLYSLWLASQKEGIAATEDLAENWGVVMRRGRVQVEVVAQEGQRVAAMLAVDRHGGTVEGTYEELIQALVPVKELLPLAEEDAVAMVRRPERAVPRG